jgi:hypothetical protein
LDPRFYLPTSFCLILLFVAHLSVFIRFQSAPLFALCQWSSRNWTNSISFGQCSSCSLQHQCVKQPSFIRFLASSFAMAITFELQIAGCFGCHCCSFVSSVAICVSCTTAFTCSHIFCV